MTKFSVRDQNKTRIRAKIRVYPVFLVRPKLVITHNFIVITPIYINIRSFEFAESTLKLSLLRLF